MCPYKKWTSKYWRFELPSSTLKVDGEYIHCLLCSNIPNCYLMIAIMIGFSGDGDHLLVRKEEMTITPTGTRARRKRSVSLYRSMSCPQFDNDENFRASSMSKRRRNDEGYEADIIWFAIGRFPPPNWRENWFLMTCFGFWPPSAAPNSVAFSWREISIS